MKRQMRMYAEFARVAFLKILAYRLRYFTGIVTYFVNVSVYYFIWRAIYSDQTRVAGYDLSQIVTYVAVGWILRSFYYNNVDRDIASEVLEGKIAINLVKPIDTQLMYVAQTAGEALFRALMFTAPITVVLLLVYPIAPPAGILASGAFAVSCVLSLLIFTTINFVVGSLALELQSIVGVIRAKYFIVEFLSGLLIPISFFPERLQRVIAWLPFPHISYTPLQIYLGKTRGLALAEALALQALWVAVLYLAGRYLWSYLTRRLSILGG